MEKYMIMYGNVVDGMKFIGPFDSGEDALGYAEMELTPEDWWIVPLQSPSQEHSEVTDG